MKMEILGTGCAKCDQLEKNAREAAVASGIECEVVKVRDLREIAAHGVMVTPALVIDGVVIASGRVLSPAQIAAHLPGQPPDGRPQPP